MNLRFLIPLIVLLAFEGAASAQSPQSGTPNALQSPAAVQSFATASGSSSDASSNAPSQSFNNQTAEPSSADRPDILNPPANFVAPRPKKADDDPADAPLLVPIPPAEEIPFDTAEYRSNRIPWEQFPTATSPAQ